MENMDIILEKIKFVEQGFSKYDSSYYFENGIEYDDNGTPISYNTLELAQEIKNIRNSLDEECIYNIRIGRYYNAKCNIALLERLNDLLIELES